VVISHTCEKSTSEVSWFKCQSGDTRPTGQGLSRYVPARRSVINIAYNAIAIQAVYRRMTTTGVVKGNRAVSSTRILNIPVRVLVSENTAREVRPLTSLAYPVCSSRVVSVLDSGAEEPEFKSQPRRNRITVLGKLFTPIVPLFIRQQNW